MATVNNAAMNNGLHASFGIMLFSRKCPGVGHMVIIFLVFLRSCRTVHHSGCTNLHAHQQCKSVPFSPHSFQELSFVECLLIAIQTGVK